MTRPSSNVSLWTSNLKDPQEVEEFETAMKALGHSVVLKRLLEMVQRDRENVARTALSTRNYDSPSWGFIQADSAGYQRALMTIEALLKGILKT